LILLSVTIVIALLVTIALPIAAGTWLNKKLGIPWSVIIYGVLAYFIVQTVLVLIFAGLGRLVENGSLTLTENAYFYIQVGLSTLFTAIFGVLLRWAAMRFIKVSSNNLESAYAIGLGYGGAESLMIMGLPLLTTFLGMIQNVGDVATAEAWELSPLIPLGIAVERLTFLVLHITVTMLIFQIFNRKKIIWLLAAMGLETFITGLTVALSEIGVQVGWVILVAAVFMVGNLYLLFKLKAFKLDFSKGKSNRDTNFPVIKE
jgi:uncharacterized membrane protein YhfC